MLGILSSSCHHPHWCRCASSGVDTQNQSFACTVPGKIYIERPTDTSAAATAIHLVQALTNAGVPTFLRNDIQSLVDTKLLLNAALNPVNAWPAYLSQSCWQIQCFGPFGVGKSRSQSLGNGPGWLFRSLLHPDYKSSVLQDIERKRKATEVEDFNGEICKRGRAPLHHIVLSLVKALEQEQRFVHSSEELLTKLGLSTN